MTTNKTLHIVSFDVPFPPNYGGVIDVFYKIKNLAEKGVKIYLHTYEYGRGKQKELDKYCEKVYYYDRNTSFLKLLSRKPFIVNSRKCDLLISNLKKDNFPILFEGLHTTFPLIDNLFNDRKTLVRTHNIEHDYYKGLRKSETSKRKKIFFETESQKLKKYENILHKADHILTISPFEHEYFRAKFGEKSTYVPVFHQHESSDFTTSLKNKFTLWHGDLRVADNIKAALFMIRVFSKLKHQLVIASSFNNKNIISEVSKYKNITFDNLHQEDQMENLYKNAHIHTLLSYQKTGIKLKLINVLCKGKFIIANSKIIEDTGLEEACYSANTENEFKETIENLLQKDFDYTNLDKRFSLLKEFNPIQSVEKIIALL